MKTKPKTIYAKGLILIAIPLCVELLFGLTMFSLQHYYQRKLDRERNAVEIIFHANELWMNCTQLMYVKGYFCFFGGPRPPLEQRMAQLMEGYHILKNLVANDAAQTQNLKRVWSYTNQSLALGNDLVPLASAGHSASQKMAVLASNIQVLSKCQHFVHEMGEELQHFRAPKFLHSSEAIPEVESSKTILQGVIISSLAASTLVALLLFAYFLRSISQEIHVIVRNTDRFKQGVELEAPVNTGDELAQVDAAFHQMADEIQEAQRTKQRIVSMISHDLRSPLTSVLGYLSNFKAGVFGDAPEGTLRNAAKYEQEIEALIQLINDLLDLDKIDAGKFELRTRSLSADQLLDRAINKVFSLADQHDVNISPPIGSARLHGDPDRMLQAVANVLSTTVRWSPAGSSIETSVEQRDGQAEIRITAASAQVTQDQLNALFDRYQQSGTALRLELPLSKEILKLHGGTITAIATEPKGLTFTLLLPSAESS